MSGNEREKIGVVGEVSSEPDADTITGLAYAELSAAKALRYSNHWIMGDLSRRLNTSEDSQRKLTDDLQNINNQARKGETYLAILTKSNVQTVFGTVCAMVGAGLIANDLFKIGWTVSLFAVALVVCDQIGTSLSLRPNRPKS